MHPIGRDGGVMRNRLGAAAVTLLAMALGVATVHAQASTVDIEVRITAQRLADGRTEFALQHREPEGTWSDRILPRARFFPATSEAGGWLISTAVTVRAPGASGDHDGTEVRIAARRLESGRIEFALRHLKPGAEWSARVLPRARFFPTSPRAGRWLVSSPLTVAVPEIVLAEEPGSPGADRAALVAFYDATRGDHWQTSTNWLTDAPLHEWYGVSTNAEGRVTSLVFPPNWLRGSLPPELGELTELEELSLDWSGLTGPIPPALGKLSRLRKLVLVDAQLSGPIPPALGNLTGLTELKLHRNQLSGTIPPALGNLTSLRVLSLFTNNLTGEMPAELGRLTHLEQLDVGDNGLSGPIPVELGALTALTELKVWRTRVSGPVPPELGNLRALRKLQLWRNRLTGPIPAELGNLTHLTFLDLSENLPDWAHPGGVGQSRPAAESPP